MTTTHILLPGQSDLLGAGLNAVKDTESDVHGQVTRQRELQLVVEQGTVWEDSFLDAGLHWTLKEEQRIQTAAC